MNNLGGKDASLKWASEQFARGQELLTRIAPVTTLDSVQQGDVLASASGNFRLVLCTQNTSAGVNVSFLSLLRTGVVTMEGALLHKIAAPKLAAIVRRNTGNPLERFAAVAKNLENERTIFYNIQVLLRDGILGEHLQGAINTLKNTGETYAYVDFWVASLDGRIEKVGESHPPTPSSSFSSVSLMFNLMELPGDEFIKNARFNANCNAELKTNILAACVFANTIANAKSLLMMARLAGK